MYVYIYIYIYTHIHKLIIRGPLNRGPLKIPMTTSRPPVLGSSEAQGQA